MSLTIWDLIKYIYKWKIAIIITVICSFLLSYIYVNNNQSYTSEVVIKYTDSCIKEGKNLYGEVFDVYEIASPTVITEALKDLEGNYTVDSIRSKIKITPIIPDTETAIRAAKEKSGEEYSYYPDTYRVAFKGNSNFSETEARDILDSVVDHYLSFYTEKYLKLATLSEIDYGMENGDFDYIEQAEILQDNIESTLSTLSSYSNANSAYRSPSTGLTFKDISQEFTYLRDFTMPVIFSEIYTGQVTKNKALLLDKYTEKMEQYQLEGKNFTDKAKLAEDRMNAFAGANVDVPNSYNVADGSKNDDGIRILDEIHEDWENRRYNEQTTYDTLIKNYVDDSVASNNDAIEAKHCKDVISVFSAEANPDVDKAAYTKSVDANIKEATKELELLYENTYKAVDDYNAYIVAQHMEFLTGVKFYGNLSGALYALVAVMVGLMLSCIGAIAFEVFCRYTGYTFKKRDKSKTRADETKSDIEEQKDEKAEEPSEEKIVTEEVASQNKVFPDDVFLSGATTTVNAKKKDRKKKTFQFSGKMKIMSLIVLLLILIVAAFCGYIKYDNSRIINTIYKYSSTKVTEAFDGYRIAVVTDYHNSDKVDKTIAQISAAEPDIICIVGDLVDMNTEDFSNTIDFVNKAGEIAPVYYSYGNHEIWSNNYNNTKEPVIAKELKESDVNFLNDETIKIEKGGEYIYLTGFEDMKYDDLENIYENALDDKLDKLSKNITDGNALSILMFHRANYFGMVSDYPYDLVLSGHIHGGQVRIPGIMDKIVESHVGSSKYIKGEYTEYGKTMLVCGGIALKDSAPRMFNTPEIMTVELEHILAEDEN